MLKLPIRYRYAIMTL